MCTVSSDIRALLKLYMSNAENAHTFAYKCCISVVLLFSTLCILIYLLMSMEMLCMAVH